LPELENPPDVCMQLSRGAGNSPKVSACTLHSREARRRITDKLEHDEVSGLCKNALHNTHVAIEQHLMLNAAEYSAHLQSDQELENE
jgi:hypothetical protein